MHDEARAFVASWAALLTPRRRVLEVGSLEVNGRIRDLFPFADYRGIDVRPGPGVDVVADGRTYDPPDRFGLVLCCETAEHMESAAGVFHNLYDLLEPGGMLLVTAAGPNRPPHSGVDGGELRAGEFYAAVTEQRLREWLIRFGAVLTGSTPDGLDVRAVAVRMAP